MSDPLIEGAGWLRTPIQVPLAVHVAATEDGDLAVTEQDIQDSIDRANESMAPFGVRVYVASVDVLAPGHANVTAGEDRLRLAELAATNGALHVFFVRKVALFSPRHGDSRVSGMHWRYHGLHNRLRQREYLVVAHDAPLTTLVHEIGHAFGLGHDRSIDNLMCSCRRGETPGFTKKQGKRMRTGARRFLFRTR